MRDWRRRKLCRWRAMGVAEGVRTDLCSDRGGWVVEGWVVVVVVGKSRLWVGPKLKFADARSCAITCTRFPEQLCCRGPAVQSPFSDLTGRLTPPLRKYVCFAGPLRRCAEDDSADSA